MDTCFSEVLGAVLYRKSGRFGASKNIKKMIGKTLNFNTDFHHLFGCLLGVLGLTKMDPKSASNSHEKTIDFSIDFGDEFCVRVIKPRWRSPQIPTPICGCKNQQNIENQCFYLEIQFRTKPCAIEKRVTLCGSAKVPGIIWESSSHSEKIQCQWGGLRLFLRRDGLGSPESVVD